jgi:thiol-disulfide isomerase/thioredoxin
MPKLNNAVDSMMSNPLVHVICVLILIIIVLAIIRIVYPSFSAGVGLNAHVGTLKGSVNFEAFEGFDNHNSPTLAMYYADWCGHCKKAKPYFEELMKKNPNGISLMLIDAEDKKNADLVKSQNIQGFPTIRYYADGLNNDYKEFDGERTLEGFQDFIGRMMNN